MRSKEDDPAAEIDPGEEGDHLSEGAINDLVSRQTAGQIGAEKIGDQLPEDGGNYRTGKGGHLFHFNLRDKIIQTKKDQDTDQNREYFDREIG